MNWSLENTALRDQVAVVAGATRGAGRGIAAALGEAGATVICTGRSTRSRRSEYDRAETIEETAELVTQLGGVGVDLIVHTPGGLVLAAEQIAHALLRHQAPVTIFVPHYAMSGGTMLALACDQMVMDPNAVLGPVDPQLGPFAAASILEAVAQKPVAQVSDQTLIMADLARKALAQVWGTVIAILTIGGMDRARAEALAETLATGTVTHDYPITFERAKTLGLPVSDEFPKEVHELMSQYAMPTNRRPSVMYVPLPSAEGGPPPR